MEVLAIFLAAATGVVTYVLGERAKRKATTAESKRSLYEGLIRSLVSLLAVEGGDRRSESLSQAELSWLFASDEVLTAVYAYLNTCDEMYCRIDSGTAGDAKTLASLIRSSAGDRRRIEQQIGQIFLGMRKDLGVKETEASRKAQEQLRLYKWGIIEQAESARDGSTNHLDENTVQHPHVARPDHH